ncbi:hypothetical protein M378DRAFT_175217 [Amanita muscaria Koide BX008]|uniref:Uncharacterized protein n=1 Tax=Amanita muscaria (strain Koide BX008) TaxID=946122 RepID=A0A0C2TU84_AMAMK|nr:hypothetical protein M378DRAFT_175217 [Amanita muscaria Koide BX008]
MQPALDYLRPSPVRGQLEPPDPSTLQGWRYIQTTDTPNELKVLLPPGTASMYDQLLKFEGLELTRRPSISWERIMQIRHLKDRMIRKCQRLTRASYPRKLSKGEPLTFQTIVAPSDFRVKEMEKWFREQQRLLAPRSETVRSISLNEHSNRAAMPPPGGEFGPLPSSSKYHSLPLRSRRILPVAQAWSDSRATASPASAPQHAISGQLQQPNPLNDRPYVQAAKEPSVLSTAAFSPPALPILLRSERTALEDSLIQQKNSADWPVGGLRNASEPSLPFSDRAVLGSIPPASSSEESLNALHPGEHGIRRRRSCIKRTSIGDIPKTVSWADETEFENRLSIYANAAKDAQLSGGILFWSQFPILQPFLICLPGRKWEEIREIYLEQMSSLDALQEQVSQGLTSLRLESEHLERVEKTISQQRDAMRATFQDLEQKQSLFKSKGAPSILTFDELHSSCTCSSRGPAGG